MFYLINVAFFTALILVSLRLVGFFLVTPVFFPKGTPIILKVGFILILSYILMPGIDYSAIASMDNTLLFIGNCVSEITTGISLGFITQLCFMAAKIAGNLMDLQIGFSMITMLDPNSNSNSTLIDRLMYWVSFMLFLGVDGHHMFIMELLKSFKTVKLGNFILGISTSNIIIEAFVQFFIIGLKIAIPIILIIVITDLTLGLIGRTVPQLNVMILGFPLKIMVGLASLLFAMPIFIHLIERAFSMIPDAFNGFYKAIPPIMFIFASEDKTEEATPHKLSEARKKGQVAKSKEVNLALTLLASTMALSFLGDYVLKGLKDIMVTFLGNYIRMDLTYNNVFYLTLTIVLKLAMIILPVVIPIMVIGVFANMLQTGVLITKEPLKPDIKKLNPISGFKKMFSVRTVVELLKDLVLVTIVGVVGYKFLKSRYVDILNLNTLRFPILLDTFRQLAVSIFFKITLVMIFVAIADFVFQKKQFKKDMRMTKQEVKEEFKQEEGDPQIKGKIKQKQREMAMRRMMQSVPDATVVITNPTHLAVALKYDENEKGAPKVIAKGADYVAIKIKEKARESNVPIMENKPLARLIYKEVELDEEIPVSMYEAVAQILAVVMKLNKN